MAESGGLWDDSALINAFDDAMSNYKKMHKKKYTESHGGAGNDPVGNTKDNAATGADESNGVTRELGENHSKIETAEIEEQAVQDNQGAINGSTNLQGTEEYNRLLNQYYELDEKRVKIWEQLHQFENWNYQYSGEKAGFVAQGEMPSAPQENHITASQACCQNVGFSSCHFVCPYLPSLCTACSGCCTSLDPNFAGKPPSAMNDDIFKLSMGTVEKAISSLRIDSSTIPNNGEENQPETATTPSSETDLSVVLSAWYSAGFYTGKYLAEQSRSKKTDT